MGEISSPQTATDVVAKQSLGSWSLLWSLNSHIGCGSTSLLVLVQGLARLGISLALWKIEMTVTHLTPLFTSFTTVRTWI